MGVEIFPSSSRGIVGESFGVCARMEVLEDERDGAQPCNGREEMKNGMWVFGLYGFLVIVGGCLWVDRFCWWCVIVLEDGYG